MKQLKLFRKVIPAVVAAALTFGAANQSSAATVEFNFGDLLPGQSGVDDSSIWGRLVVTTINAPTDTIFRFDLSLDITNFTQLFGSSAFVSEAVFNTPSGVDPWYTSQAAGTWGVSGVALITSAPDLGLGFDFGDCFSGHRSRCNHDNPDTGRLTAGEKTSWYTKFSGSQGDPLVFGVPAAGLHVEGISTGTPSNAWYGPTAVMVPEPESYALLMAGLALLGVTARRRKQVGI